MKAMRSLAFLAFLVGAICSAPALADTADTVDSKILAEGRPAKAGEICLACGRPVGSGDLEITHRGRRVAVHKGACLEAWQAHPEVLFASLQPRGALFQEPEEPSSPLKDAWLLFGLYVVAGLVAGAACAYLAVGRGLSPLPWFFAGLFLNVAALAAILFRSPHDLSRFPAGVPAGLAKVPTTRSPRFCPSCGADSHPSARACNGCGAKLDPLVEPEMGRATSC